MKQKKLNLMKVVICGMLAVCLVLGGIIIGSLMHRSRHSMKDTMAGAVVETKKSKKAKTYYADVYESLTVRAEPSTSATPLGYVEPFGTMTYLAESGIMYKVRVDATGLIGWVNSDYLATSTVSCIRAGKTAKSSSSKSGSQSSKLRFKRTSTLSTSKYSYDDMMQDVATLKAKYPALMQVRTLAQSYDQRDIIDIMIGDPESSRHVIVQYSMHAREYINTMICMEQLYSYLKGYETATYKGQTYQAIFSDICFHIIPMSNPDGVTISQEGLKGIRDEKLKAILKKCYQADGATGGLNKVTTYWRRWKANARGVDLNRNFDSDWDVYQGTSHPSSDKYKGEAPASEVETQAILSLVDDYPIIGCISCHSAFNVIFYDYGSTGDVYDADVKLAKMVSELTGYALKRSNTTGQDPAGCSDYFVLKLGIPAVTIENGSGTCPLPFSQLTSLNKKNKKLWPALALHFKS